MRFRKRPVEVEATQWFKNGDHPDDYKDDRVIDMAGNTKPGYYFREHAYEGAVVRYFRNPGYAGNSLCRHCGQTMHVHGWIDTFEGGHIVCPGDWVITGIAGERYPCKPTIFADTYERVE